MWATVTPSHQGVPGATDGVSMIDGNAGGEQLASGLTFVMAGVSVASLEML